MEKADKITIYHNNKCSKSCAALNALEQTGQLIKRIEYLKDVPSIAELNEIISKLNCVPHDLIRTSEPIYKEKFKGKFLRDADWVQAMHEYPILIQRPIVIKGEKAVIARSSETIQDILDTI